VADASDHPRPDAAPSAPRTGWLLWPLLAAAWLSVLFWGWQAVERMLPVRMPRTRLAPPGQYDTVVEWLGPVSCRLETLDTVRLAGVTPPVAAGVCDRARNRLAELAPAGTRVYVEPAASAGDDATAAPAVSIFLPPAGAEPVRPFPYGRARLLAAVLVQEGLARADADTPNAYRAELEMLQDDARRHRRGLWAEG